MEIDYLQKIDNLRQISFEKCSCYLHEDHRWVLPIVFHEQENENLPKPCTLVMFDAHHDSKDPTCIDEIRKIRASEINLEKLISLCQDKLDSLDGDWVKAGMELGLIDDAVIFGVKDTFDIDRLKNFKDHLGHTHKIELVGLPGYELGHQCCLSDVLRYGNNTELWKILSWQYTPNNGFAFLNNERKILLDFDLDCFVIRWDDYRLPWPDEVFEGEFFDISNSIYAEGWTGKKFLDELLNRAALLTIAMESECCGSVTKANEILQRVNKFLFDGRLNI